MTIALLRSAIAVRACVGAAAFLALAVLLLAPAEANGTAIKVVLAYTQGVSNFGPATATGAAEILMKEGEIKVTAAGLQPLITQTYQFWLMNTRTNEVYSGGRLSPDARGAVSVTNVLPAEIPNKGYNLAFFSVEGPDIVARTPSAQRSIAGPVAPAPGSEERPAVLPNTGGELPGRGSYVVVPPMPSEAENPMRWAAGALFTLLAAAGGYLVGRRTVLKENTR